MNKSHPYKIVTQSKKLNKFSGNIFITASGKGGVGKTWFSITLAHALAQQGKKVLLFDGDLGLANIDIQLGLMPDKDLGNVFTKQCNLKEIITNHPSGQFDVIAGRSGCGLLSSLSPQRLAFLTEEIKSIAQDYDSVLIDLGTGIGETVRALSSIASECIVMTTQEPTSLTDAYAFIKLSTQNALKCPIRIVVNQVDSLRAGTRTYETLQKVCYNFLKLSPLHLGSVRRDQRVKDSIKNQALTLMRYPNSEAARDIESIAFALSS